MPELTLRQLQEEHQPWLKHNFPSVEPWEALVGLQEEVGELAHAHLKGFNGIRGLKDGTTIAAAKQDAVGDILIYLVSYCITNSLDLQHCLEVTWNRVKARDWIADPDGETA